MTAHRIVRYADATGFRASCSCNWRTARKTRGQREQDIDAHEVQAVDEHRESSR